MPQWLLWIIGIAGGISGLYVIAQKGLRPTAKFITQADELIPLLIEVQPLLRAIQTQFVDNETALSVLKEIAAEFRNDSGSTLRDAIDLIVETARQQAIVLDRLETSSDKQLVEAKVAKVGAKAESDLSIDDRVEIAKLVAAVQALVASGTTMADTLHAHTELPVDHEHPPP